MTASPRRGEGLAVGLIAYASVALFYGLFDFVAARGWFYTVDRLGRAVFRDVRDPATLVLPSAPDLTGILWYNALHLVLSLVIGLVVVRLIHRAEDHPDQGRLMLGLIVLGYLATVLVAGLLSAPMRPVLPWWSIVLANALASLLAGLYLVARAPARVGLLLGRRPEAPTAA